MMALCGSCEEPGNKGDMIEFQGLHFHPKCMAHLDWCRWCGEGEEKAKLTRHTDGDLYHPRCIPEMEAREAQGRAA